MVESAESLTVDKDPEFFLPDTLPPLLVLESIRCCKPCLVRNVIASQPHYRYQKGIMIGTMLRKYLPLSAFYSFR